MIEALVTFDLDAGFRCTLTQGPLGPENLKAQYGLSEVDQLKLYRVLYSYTVSLPCMMLNLQAQFGLYGGCAQAVPHPVLLHSEHLSIG